MNVLVWHVHGSWTTAFVQGTHRYVVPVVAGRGPDGRGRAETWEWPANVVEATPAQLADEDIDVVVIQRPEDEELASRWTRRRPGRDLAAVWVEHNAPQGRIAEMRHPAADRDDVVVVHVTHTNDLYWDCGSTRSRVIEHGVVDPGQRYTGELARAAVVVNDPLRRWRVVGADLLAPLSEAMPIDLFGMGSEELVATLPPAADVRAHGDVPQARLHDEIARRRVYLHTVRWTSLGLSLIEAMALGMPVVALATTEVPRAVPAIAGTVSNDLGELRGALAEYRAHLAGAQRAGVAAREAALGRYSLKRFLDDWDELIEEVVR